MAEDLAEPGGQKRLVPAIKVTPRQLQAKFKHAIDFGIQGSFNRTRAEEFEAALRAHVAAPSTRIVVGTFRRQEVLCHVNSDTGLAVLTDRAGTFVSAWKLSGIQLTNVLERGTL